MPGFIVSMLEGQQWGQEAMEGGTLVKKDTEVFLCASLSNLNICPWEEPREVSLTQEYTGGERFTELWMSLRKITAHLRGGPFLS